MGPPRAVVGAELYLLAQSAILYGLGLDRQAQATLIAWVIFTVLVITIVLWNIRQNRVMRARYDALGMIERRDEDET
ncbi:hypothetical protein ABZ801_00960 [Actinomadura sp. NPDC047616]|uniref:hypothetical protein n=1 Tax=Actinomadura sp. NPDC047616 TaxID=3155914 RepID=UPI0033F97115